MAEISGYNKNINNPGINQPIPQSRDIAQAGGVKGSQKVQKAVDRGTEQTAQKVQKQEIETISRRMTSRDIVNQLLQIGVRASQENRALALKMLILGLELSKENFQKITNLLQGLKRNAYTEQAAMIAINKGLDSKTGVQQLAAFLENNPEMSVQLNALLAQTSEMQNLISGQTMLSPQLSARLTAIMTSLQGFIAALPDNIRKELQEGRGLLSKSGLLTNMRAVKAIFNGVAKQVEAEGGSTKANNLLTALGKMANHAKEVAENIIVQAILSRPSQREDSAMGDKFAYWQIPNTLATPPETFELLVLRDKKNKNKSINKKKTKLILKATTKGLGELAIEVDVDDDNLDFKFNTKEEEIRKLISSQIESLAHKLEAYKYKTRSVRVVKRNLDVKKFLIPTLDLNNLTRVQSEA